MPQKSRFLIKLWNVILIIFLHETEPEGLSDGAIAGVVIACLLIVAMGAAGGCTIYKRK